MRISIFLAVVVAMLCAMPMRVYALRVFAIELSGGEVVHTGGSYTDDPHVLRFSGIVGTDADRNAIRNADGAVLRLSPPWSGSANRAMWVWTDLSADVQGASGNPSELSFLTSANANAGAILRTTEVAPVALEIPQKLLYANGTFAEHIYIITTLNDHGSASTPFEELFATPGGFRRDITDSITAATLEPRVPTVGTATNISLNWGENETEMRFTWWTPRGTAQASVVQIARESELVGGQMPQDARTVTGHAPVPIPSNLQQYAFDVSRASVTGLTPNTRYMYRVGDGTPDNWSDIFHFDTFDPANTGRQTVLIAGDPQFGAWGLTRQLDKWQHGLAAGIERAAAHGGVDFILNTGDVTTPANSVERMNYYLTPYQLRNIPVFVTVGNHDTVTQRTDAGYESPLGLLYFIHYWPNHDWLGGNPTHASNYLRGGGNHFFSYGDVLYISLNTNNRSMIQEHRPTLEAAVASHPDATWRIVIFHQNIFGGGNFHAPAMPASGWWALSGLFDEFGIDLVINGHDHTHGRSHFIRNAEPVTQQRPADFARNRLERLVFDAHPGVFVAPEGIPFITAGSISDFPKYTAFYPMLPWVAWVDPAQFDNYSQYSIMTIDGDSLTIETFVIPYDPQTWTPTGEPEIMSTSFTIRQTARVDDLMLLVEGGRAFEQGDVTDESWAVFRNALQLRTDDIHAAYMAIYDAYFALENTADFSALFELIADASAVLADAVEGPWYGQFPDGAIETFRAEYFTPAVVVNNVRLSMQADINAQYSRLSAAFAEFTASASSIPRPWVDVHEIPATGVYTMGLLNWMYDSQPLNPCPRGTCEHPCWLVRPWECADNVTRRFFSHFTKINFAGGSLENDHVNLSPPRDVPVRPDQVFGPANAYGGRAPIPFGQDENGDRFTFGHITRPHAGEWIRYELYVAQEGTYRVQLGAINPHANAMEVRLRGTEYNLLTHFTIPAQHGVNEGWTDANPLIEAAHYIQLPQGHFVLEMLFMNDGTRPTRPGASGTPAVYTDGPNVDILTFERVGGPMERIDFLPTNYLVLPLPPMDAAGMPHRQRGWATVGVSREFGTITESPISLGAIGTVTQLVFDVAAQPVASTAHIALTGGAAGNWAQDEMPLIFDPAARTVTIELSNHSAFSGWRAIGDGAPRGIIISHNNDTWDDMNVTRAFFVLESGGETAEAQPAAENNGGTPLPPTPAEDDHDPSSPPVPILRLHPTAVVVIGLAALAFFLLRRKASKK
ncbi:MAG: fibronectin type III domain-containing protein [Defluviitaleaceae bacterium]|nr:fibronectin type III domain-containing protein [Defluviitaleaceae bacterium]MCL2261626.1 fibronectin type III domain-containing protein [Defluviitaleaceae bacterium]